MMNYIWKYKTPEGFDDLVMCGDGEALTGLWFEGSRDDWRNTHGCERRETPVFRDTRRWLDEYFAGHDPGFTPNYRIEGLTPFRQAVIDVIAALFKEFVVLLEAGGVFDVEHCLRLQTGYEALTGSE